MNELTKQIEALVQAQVTEQVSSMVEEKLDTIARVVEAVRTGGTLSELDDEVRDLKADLAFANALLEEEKAKTEKLEAEVEHRKAENKKLLEYIGDIPTEMKCDECGEAFEPIKKRIRKVRAYCEKHAHLMDGPKDPNEQYDDYKTRGVRKHEALPYDVKFSPKAVASRSEAQQMRRVVEKASNPKPKIDHECPYCGKLTNKVYCSEDCRKALEKEAMAPIEDKVIHDTEREYQKVSNAQIKTLSAKYAPKSQIEKFEERKVKAEEIRVTPNLPKSFNFIQAAQESKERLLKRAVVLPNREDPEISKQAIERVKEQRQTEEKVNWGKI